MTQPPRRTGASTPGPRAPEDRGSSGAGGSRPGAPRRGPNPPRPLPPDAEERSARVRSWVSAGSVLVGGVAIGSLFLTRFPQTIGLGLLALAGVVMAIYSLHVAKGLPVRDQIGRSAWVAIIFGSLLGLLHVTPALSWSLHAQRQDCLDAAVTREAREVCGRELTDGLWDQLELPTR